MRLLGVARSFSRHCAAGPAGVTTAATLSCCRAGVVLRRSSPAIETDVGLATSPSTTDDGTPKFFHYVKKDQIVDSAISGKMVVALCGETFPVKKQAKPGSPVCPDCERIYKGLRRK